MKRLILVILLMEMAVVNGYCFEDDGKWETAFLPARDEVQVNRRNADNSGFEPMIVCDKHQRHCKYKINADEMLKEINKMFKIIGECK